MLMLTKAREAAGLTRARLGAEANVHPARVGQIENRRVVPYSVELERLALALDWPGDHVDLLKEVDDGPAA
jgi:transcriptional regulator with XRE-family HTH domain